MDGPPEAEARTESDARAAGEAVLEAVPENTEEAEIGDFESEPQEEVLGESAEEEASEPEEPAEDSEPSEEPEQTEGESSEEPEDKNDEPIESIYGK